MFPSMTWGFSHSNDTVYLTFDDGPNPDITDWIMDLLKEHNSTATFFCVGDKGLLYPEILERIRKNGHSIGNHTMKHEKGRSTKTLDYLNSVEMADKVFKTRLFRPPYGSITKSQTKELTKKGYKIVMWSWLTYDFDVDLPIEKIISSAQNLKGGDVVVLHDNTKCFDRLKMILPELIKIAEQKNLLVKAIPE
jgi:peptidoglycan/xylan/chitin deacetylase (PgdA/CDA1 family)